VISIQVLLQPQLWHYWRFGIIFNNA